jgi:hypothetical protein
VAKVVDVGVVFVVAAGAENQEVAAVSFFAEPAESIVDHPPAEKSDAKRGFGGDIAGLTETEILVRGGKCERKGEQK